MNTKTAHSKTKASTSSVVRKRVTLNASAKARHAVAPASAHKLPARNRIKAATPSNSIDMPEASEPGRDSKQARLIALLRARPGATINQMMKLTGWQAHTVRGTISRVLRKKLLLVVTCDSSAKSGEHVYRIVGSVAVA